MINLSRSTSPSSSLLLPSAACMNTASVKASAHEKCCVTFLRTEVISIKTLSFFLTFAVTCSHTELPARRLTTLSFLWDFLSRKVGAEADPAFYTINALLMIKNTYTAWENTRDRRYRGTLLSPVSLTCALKALNFLEPGADNSLLMMILTI